ncbi:hypothetical protein B0J14DRAFT_684313 [Halenospora varia]|nr:hypothetical protein B0J14DRAFT_684313 [Halenospora varia]
MEINAIPAPIPAESGSPNYQLEKVPPSLLTLPKELSQKIYGYLLDSPDDGWYEKNYDRLGLHPQILAACSEIYFEAVDLLYNGTKIFTIELNHTHGFQTVCLDYRSPLTRYSVAKLPNHPCPDFADDYKFTKDILLSSRVRHWEVDMKSQTLGLLPLCRVFSYRSPKGVAILRVCNDCLTGANTGIVFKSAIGYLVQIYWPIFHLRNLSQVRFGCTKCYRQDGGFDTRFQEVLKSVAQGKPKIDYVFQMYERLLSYAQSFESHLTFRDNMRYYRPGLSIKLTCRD